MGKPFISIHLRTAVEGLKCEISMSPGLFQELVSNGGQWSWRDEDAVLMVDIHEKDGRGREQSLAYLEFHEGVDEWDLSVPPPYDDMIGEVLPFRDG